ncbi:hypothetical protein QCA50_010543 [Cerrena zonata]|uniref:Uncharacterized protein n=1 Tax=Cerrena zonata TaxID=2478898 RepID=A0AAW0G7Q6_9APHY
MLSKSLLTILATFANLAAAQTIRRRPRHSLAGRVIAGIVVAIVCGLLLLMLCCVCCVRRRRRGQGVLPGPNGGYGRFNVPFAGVPHQATGPGSNTAAGGYREYNAPQQAGYQQPQGGVPPPYPASKEQNAQSGGFAPPPGPPPAAHINDNSRFGWFKDNN